APWSADALLQPTSKDALPFGARGLAILDTSDLYVTNFNTGALVDIPIQADGKAGPATAVSMPAPLTNPESIRAVDASTLVVAEDVWQSLNGRLSKITIAEGA